MGAWPIPVNGEAARSGVLQDGWARLRAALRRWVLPAVSMAAAMTMMCAGASATVTPVPRWTAPVTDLTGTLDASQVQALTAQVQALARTRGSQLFVLMVATTGSDTIEQYARRVFDQWRVGRKGVDDGVLLLVAKHDRRVRIDVGYGLEGAVTDALAGRIIREQMTPRFAAGDFAGGLTAGVHSLVQLISGEPLPPPPASSSSSGDDDAPLFMLAPIALMALVVPAPMAAFMLGAFVWVATESPGWAALSAVLGFFLAWLGHTLGWARRFQRSGGPDSLWRGGGDSGGSSGGEGGSGGGGSGGGGGGSGGGGGASGSW